MKNNNNNDFRSKSNKDKRIIFSLGALDQFNTVAEKFSTATKSASPKKPSAMSELIFKKGLKAELASKDSDSLRFKTVRKEECASTSKDFVLGESKDFEMLSEMLAKAPQPKTPILTPIVKKGDLMTEMLSSSKGVKASSNYMPVKKIPEKEDTYCLQKENMSSQVYKTPAQKRKDFLSERISFGEGENTIIDHISVKKESEKKYISSLEGEKNFARSKKKDGKGKQSHLVSKNALKQARRVARIAKLNAKLPKKKTTRGMFGGGYIMRPINRTAACVFKKR